MLLTNFIASYLLAMVLYVNSSLNTEQQKQKQQRQQQLTILQNPSFTNSKGFHWKNSENKLSTAISENGDLVIPTVRSLQTNKKINNTIRHDQFETFNDAGHVSKREHNRGEVLNHYYKQPPALFGHRILHPEQSNADGTHHHYAHPEKDNANANTAKSREGTKRREDLNDLEQREKHKIKKSIDQSQEENYMKDAHNDDGDADANGNDKSYHEDGEGLPKNAAAVSVKKSPLEKLINKETNSPTKHEIRYFHDIYKWVAGPTDRSLFGHIENGPQLFEKRFESKNKGNRYRGEVLWTDKLSGDSGAHRWDLVQGKL